jgi:hypothetical protein
MPVLRLAVIISVVALTAMGQQNPPQQRPRSGLNENSPALQLLGERVILN